MRKCVDLVNVFVAVIAGAYLVILPLWPERAIAASEGLIGGTWGRILVVLIGAALVTWNLAVAVQEYREGAYRRSLELTTEEGTNTVSIRALEDQLRAEIEKAPDVEAVRITLEARGEGVPLLCRLTFKLRCQEDVMHRVDELKKKVRETFFRMIPSGVGIEITASVLDLVSKQKVASADEPATQGEAGFMGPKYPNNGTEESEQT